MCRQIAKSAAAGLSLLALAACDPVTPVSSPAPQQRPADVAKTAPTPSAQSQELARYYNLLQSDLLARGLLRTDGGGPDTPYDADDLARNFETIAFYDEYARGGGLGAQNRKPAGTLSRWANPVRIGVEFGDSVPQAQRTKDKGDIQRYADRLARVTGHPITATDGKANFHVFVAGEDDRDFVQRRLRQLVPNISNTELELFQNLPRSFYCFVVAVSGSRSPHEYTRAVALIRSEHPDLVRLSCIHEEIAQGLGLPNDSPRARPSIFNDDDEFALLTSHDEKLLTLLYDPRLTPGMSAEAARPVTRIISRELLGHPL